MQVGGCGRLMLVFIILKLTNVIDWSWLWVTSPLWIPILSCVVSWILILVSNLLLEFWRAKYD